MRLISAVSGVQVPAPAPFLLRSTRHACRHDGTSSLVPAALFPRHACPRRARARCDSRRRTALLRRRRACAGRGVGRLRLGRALFICCASWPRPASRRWPASRTSITACAPDADADEAFCRALAARLGVPFDASASTSRRARARARSRSRPPAAARYAFFDARRARARRRRVATGHTPTIRPRRSCCGCFAAPGRAGSAGDPIRARAVVIRPLLDVGRAELRAYLSSRGQPFRDDESNATSRSRATACATSCCRSCSERVFARRSSTCWPARRRSPGTTRIDCDAEAIDLARLIVLTDGTGESVEVRRSRRSGRCRRRWRRGWRGWRCSAWRPSRFVGFDHVERLLGARHGQTRLSLPGQHAERRGGRDPV